MFYRLLIKVLCNVTARHRLGLNILHVHVWEDTFIQVEIKEEIDCDFNKY